MYYTFELNHDTYYGSEGEFFITIISPRDALVSFFKHEFPCFISYTKTTTFCSAPKYQGVISAVLSGELYLGHIGFNLVLTSKHYH